MVNATTKQKILNQLKEAEQRLSGEELSRRVGVSRVAVWKQIRSLIDEGYPIESSSRGYRLTRDEDLLSGLEFSEDEGILFYRELHSTMDEAVRQVRSPGIESKSFLILADHQSAGVDRSGENWTSPSGGIYLTFVIRERMDKGELESLKLKGLLAVLRLLAPLAGEELSYRRRGDILLGGRKAGGLLEEYQVRGNEIIWYALGLGLHLNDLPGKDSPETTQNNQGMTSLKDRTGRSFSRSDTVRRLKENWEALLEEDASSVLKELEGYAESPESGA